ncbi:MAG: NifU family protein [Proteobacteria bacterium]|nr:MAG: NifU family protein [Pseudomonadota bacterium]
MSELQAKGPAMDVKMMVQPTPNPYAKKIIVNYDVKSTGKITFSTAEDCAHIPLAKAVYEIKSVTQVHFFENAITITIDGNVSWDDVIEEARRLIRALLPNHQADFLSPDELRRKEMSPEIQQIEEILDRTIRPALQGDGGDLEVLSLEGNYLTIRYEGACGTCPSSVTGTLSAMQNILRAEFNPEIEVIPLQNDEASH